MNKFNIAVTLPLTLLVEVEAETPEQSKEAAKDIALHTPYEDWGDDFSTASFDIVDD